MPVIPVFLAIGVATAGASPQSRALTQAGYAEAYQLNFPESTALFQEARRADPQDPAPARALAAIAWMEILFGHGIATFEAFQGDASADTVRRPPVDPALTTRFLGAAEEAMTLAERQVALTPTDLDALYQLGASTALFALYHATVDGRTWAAFVEGRRAVRTMERVRQHASGHREAALVLGLYRYAVSTLSWPKRVLANAAGMPGDRLDGIALLEAAAAPPAETSTDAALLLMIVYNREGRPADAKRHLEQLRQRHPGNRLLALNAAATALAACEAAAVVETITTTLATNPRFDRPRVLGERAMWYYLRGAARAALADPGGADDLREALASGPRDWIRARTHLELARLALQGREERQARLELDAAERYGRRGGDTVLLESVRQFWRDRALVSRRTGASPSFVGTYSCTS